MLKHRASVRWGLGFEGLRANGASTEPEDLDFPPEGL
jgi:hypothetical protein